MKFLIVKAHIVAQI